jgi:hypothetical protein
MTSNYTFQQLLDVLVIFLIPFGGGIPGGVLLAKQTNIPWPMMMVLYLISDIILACVLEPVMILFIRLAKDVEYFKRVSHAFKIVTQKTIEYYGNQNSVWALIMIAFGVDPMTGRAVAIAAGHGFIKGWMIAIAGDMIYFTLLMVSTLWLNHILGDGTITMFIILAFMVILPKFLRRFSKKNLSR